MSVELSPRPTDGLDRARGGLWSPSPWRLALLLALTLALRLSSASAAHPIRSDGVAYIHLAEQLRAGRLAAGFDAIGPNLYPAILMALHELGLDYESAGKLWGVFISTLTLLPLMGLARLQFGRPTAWVSGFLFAVHPRLIEWAPELVRDPTFWFCCISSLYALQRSEDGYRRWWLAAAGCGIVAAIHVRMEGWLLLLPCLAMAWKWQRVAQGNWRFGRLARAILLVLAPLAAIVAINLTVARESPQWERIVLVAQSVHLKLTSSAVRASGSSSRNAGHQAAYLGKKLVKGVDACFGIPLLIGLYKLRRRLRRPEQLSQLLIGLTIIALTAAYLALHGEINSRYFLTSTLLGLPFSAYGWIVVLNWCRRYIRWQLYKPVAVATVAIAFIASAGLSGGMVDRSSLERDATLGRIIRDHCGPNAVIAAWQNRALVHYYSGCVVDLLPEEPGVWAGTVRNVHFAAVLADMESPSGPDFAAYIAAHSELGYRPVFEERLEGGIGRVLYVREPQVTASRAPAPQR